MNKMLSFNNQEGKKKIVFSGTEKNTSQQIILSDKASGSRTFSLEVVVEGENITVEIIGRAESKNSDYKKWEISLSLTGKNQTGKIDLKGVSDETGKIEFDGSGSIEKTSSRGNIEVKEHIVLFSPRAKAKAVPVLTVETEDLLSASHSASIAPFDSEVFFFLESRGISPEEGKKLLREGFLALPHDNK